MQESKMLQVVSIIAIVLGGLAALGGLADLLGGTILGASGSMLGGALGAIVIVASLVALAAAALNIYAGVVGVQNWRNPAKKGTLRTIGIVLIVVEVVSLVFALISGSLGVLSLLGLVIPILYYLGANQLADPM